MKSTCISYVLTCLFLISSFAHAQPTLRYLGRVGNIDTLGDVQVHGNFAYAVSSPPRGKLAIKIIDVSNPAQSQIAGEYISSASSYSCFEGCPPHQMKLVWPLIYLPVDDGLEIVNVEDVKSPQLISKFSVLDNNYSGYGVVDVGDSIVVWGPYNRFTYVLDVDDITSPQLLTRLDLGPVVQHPLFLIMQTIIEFPYIYAFCDMYPERYFKTRGDSILCIDISNSSDYKLGKLTPLSEPQANGLITIDEPYEMVKFGNWLYLHIGNDGFYKVDVSNPMQPVVQPSTKYPRRIYDLHLQGNYLLAATGTHLAVFEIHDGDPVFLSEISRSAYSVVGNGRLILAKVGDSTYSNVMQIFELIESSAIFHAEQYP